MKLYDIITCLYPGCSNNIELTHPNRRYCHEHQIIMEKERHHLVYLKRRGPKSFHPCLYCSLPTLRPKFCRMKCGVRFNWHTKYKFKNMKPMVRNCKVCGKLFKRVKNQKYCSVYCYGVSQTATYRKQKQRELVRVIAR